MSTFTNKTHTSKLKLQAAGGTVNPRTSIYIVRKSDEELLRLLEGGEYANVLCSRQMGKSSLILNVKSGLQEKGYATASIDIAGRLGSPEKADDWYQGLLEEIASQLGVEIDVAEWWSACRAPTINQRLFRFFRDEIAAKTFKRTIIFLDEIDSTITRSYTDDFFVAIRAMHNDRASEPLFERLSFCLAGVATPNELIKTRPTTPYNIGRTLELQDFDFKQDDLTLFFNAMADDPAKGEALVRAVLRWTGGHPYLTVRLCDQLRRSDLISPKQVGMLIKKWFSNLDNLHADSHFQQVVQILDARADDNQAALKLYKQIRDGEQVLDQTTPAHITLRLAGIVKRDQNGYLIVRNPIYGRVFSDVWVAKAISALPPETPPPSRKIDEPEEDPQPADGTSKSPFGLKAVTTNISWPAYSQTQNDLAHLSRFEQYPWEELLPRLELYALNKIRRFYWLGKLGGELPGGQQAADFVLLAVEKVCTGERHWNQQAQPNFYEFLRSGVDSLISHLVNSMENRRGIRLVLNDADQNPIYQIRANGDSPETKLIQVESEALSDPFFWEFHASLADDRLAQKFLECIYHNPSGLKPAAIAAQLAVPIEDVYNLKKRLKRRLSNYLDLQQITSHKQNRK